MVIPARHFGVGIVFQPYIITKWLDFYIHSWLSHQLEAIPEYRDFDQSSSLWLRQTMKELTL